MQYSVTFRFDKALKPYDMPISCHLVYVGKGALLQRQQKDNWNKNQLWNICPQEQKGKVTTEYSEAAMGLGFAAGMFFKVQWKLITGGW